ncbi:hypothetical protein WDW37_06730 [Bdellovibrionota bacterium FG-1]
MQRKKNPKQPSDYRTLQIRVPPDKGEWFDALDKEIEAVRTSKNERRLPNEKIWMKNRVLIEAVEVGLKEMRNKK